MNAKAESAGNMDSLKWILVVLLIAAGVAGNSYFSDIALPYRVLALMVMTVVSLFVAVQTERGAEFWQLAKDARTEIRKVVWPTRTEATQTTLVVVAIVLIAALILWALDSILGWIVSQFIG
jgi:preprotein translocase subunit SecE